MNEVQEPGSGVSRRERRKEETRGRLLKVAERLFSEKGFEATTVEEIAGAADVAKGTFFNYFGSKQVLMMALVGERIYSLLSAPPGEGDPAPRRILLTLRRIWEEFYPYRDLARQAIIHAWTQPVMPSDELRLTEVLAGLVREGQAQGVFRQEIDPGLAGELLAACFVRMCIVSYIAGGEDGEPIPIWEARLVKSLELIYYGLQVELA